jgi:hypothetical protein
MGDRIYFFDCQIHIGISVKFVRDELQIQKYRRFLYRTHKQIPLAKLEFFGGVVDSPARTFPGDRAEFRLV